jgi:hypothetical protein
MKYQIPIPRMTSPTMIDGRLESRRRGGSQDGVGGGGDAEGSVADGSVGEVIADIVAASVEVRPG